MKDNEQSEPYQVLVTEITWNENNIKGYQKQTYDPLPSQFNIDLPKQLAAQEKLQSFKDNVEAFVYNLLTRKFGHEVYSCQIWLPLEEKEKSEVEQN